jgi:hypothetical protein
MRKKLFKIFLGILIFVALQSFCYKQTAGFRCEKIHSELPFNPDWEVSIKLPPEGLLDTPFTFLGSGVQCYAFESQDKKTILKVFKHYHAWPSNDVLRELHLPSFLEDYRSKTLQARYKRLDSIFTSCKIAMEELQEETGMLYLHLNQTTHLNKQLTLIDKIGNRHRIDLDQTAFLLQKKGELVFPTLENLIGQGEMVKAKEAIHSLIKLIASRCEKGIVNRDPIMRRNFGYFENRAIEIDVGSFAYNPHMKKTYSQKRELFFETRELEEWLESRHPQLIPYFKEELNAALDA